MSPVVLLILFGTPRLYLISLSDRPIIQAARPPHRPLGHLWTSIRRLIDGLVDSRRGKRFFSPNSPERPFEVIKWCAPCPENVLAGARVQQGRHAMGDRGGQKDKDKSQKQRAAKEAAKKKKKRDKQATAREV